MIYFFSFADKDIGYMVSMQLKKNINIVFTKHVKNTEYAMSVALNNLKELRNMKPKVYQKDRDSKIVLNDQPADILDFMYTNKSIPVVDIQISRNIITGNRTNYGIMTHRNRVEYSRISGSQHSELEGKFISFILILDLDSSNLKNISENEMIQSINNEVSEKYDEISGNDGALYVLLRGADNHRYIANNLLLKEDKALAIYYYLFFEDDGLLTGYSGIRPTYKGL